MGCFQSDSCSIYYPTFCGLAWYSKPREIYQIAQTAHYVGITGVPYYTGSGPVHVFHASGTKLNFLLHQWQAFNLAKTSIPCLDIWRLPPPSTPKPPIKALQQNKEWLSTCYMATRRTILKKWTSSSPPTIRDVNSDLLGLLNNEKLDLILLHHRQLPRFHHKRNLFVNRVLPAPAQVPHHIPSF